MHMLLRIMVGRSSDSVAYSNWNKDTRHRAECEIFGISREVWRDNGGQLPWRLARAQRLILDERMGNVIWPHYVEPLFYRGFSFWRKHNRLWKTSRTIQLFMYYLPTQIRDQVSNLTFANIMIIMFTHHDHLLKLGTSFKARDLSYRLGIETSGRTSTQFRGFQSTLCFTRFSLITELGYYLGKQ